MIEKEMRIVDVANGYAALVKLNDKMSIDLAWAVDDLKEALQKHFDRYGKEMKALLNKFGNTVGGSENRFRINDQRGYDEALEALGNILVKVEFEPISFDTLLEQGVGIPGDIAKNIRPFITKVEARKPKEEKESDADQQKRKELAKGKKTPEAPTEALK